MAKGIAIGVAGLLVLGSTAAGCASNTAGVREEIALSPDSAYLYGHFWMKSERVKQTMGMVISCVDGASYGIKFSNKREVQVVKIKPSWCELDEVVYIDANGFVRRRQQPPGSWVRTQHFVAGRAYYLGDYYGKAEREVRAWIGYSEVTSTWDMDPGEDDYDATTAEMKRTFRQLASLPTENKRLAPSRHPAGYIAAAPDEPPMSPERIARIAPFTGRSYATPAACEAACPKGDCLPFRGKTGPAMTCILHCRTNKDCPEGLACNCPGGDGPDCQSIAQTAVDPMKGICMSVEP